MSSITTKVPVTGARSRATAYAPLVLAGLALSVVAEKLGAHTLDLGLGTVTLYPLIWGILLGGAASLQKVRPLPVGLQRTATYVVEVGILLLGARLSFVVGENLPVLAHAGPALLLQELGHLFGTVLFSLPLAVLLRMGRPTVGACFSIDREGSFAIVSERYGPDSDEYRGVLSMYVFGTIVGALYVTLLASFLAHAGVLSPLALAMGAGVGSGSVMAASSAAIAAQYPGMADQVLALAAVSNLITSVLGLYVGIYVALPLAERFYRFLTRRGPGRPTGPSAAQEGPVAEEPAPGPALWFSFPLMVAAMLLTVVVFNHGFHWRLVAGLGLMAALVLTAILLRRLTRLSAIVGVTTVGLLVSCPWSPVAGAVGHLIEPIDFLALTTPVLVFAGLGLGKDAGLLRRIGWRIVPVGLVSFGASFVAAAAIAEVALRVG